LPSNESKELLHKNEIFISTPTSKQPLFNYLAFRRDLLIYKIKETVFNVLKNKLFIKVEDKNDLVTNEIMKMFANQIPSLKKLTCYNNNFDNTSNFSFHYYFPGVRKLSELNCSSNLSSNFFYQLSQICHNIQSLSISFDSCRLVKRIDFLTE
jgi:hypothetical protein